MTWTSSPTTTSTGGAPKRPSSSTFQPDAFEDRVAAGEEAHEVRHLRAGHEPHPCPLGEAEQVEEPGRGHLFDHRRRRRGGAEAGVLVPRGREPVGGHRGGMAPADDEAEVARSRGRDEARLGGLRQIRDDGLRRESLLLERHAQAATKLGDAGRGPNRPAAEALEVAFRERRRRVEDLGVVHAPQDNVSIVG